MSERRQWPRLNLKLNVEFRAGTIDPSTGHRGTTANVSTGGAYFLTRDWQELRPGQDLLLQLSGLSGFASGFLVRGLSAKGVVIRLETPSHPSADAGVAVHFSERPSFEAFPELG